MAQLQKFLVYAPDMTDPDGLARRMEARSEHLEKASTNHIKGTLKLGAAMLTPESAQPGADKRMIGSVMIFEAESIDDVKAIIHADVYYTTNVWDREKLLITPIMLGIPQSL